MSSIYSIWCKKRYTGTAAKTVLEHAAHGIGYYILERPETGSAWVVAAFRRESGPLPADVVEITDKRLIDKIEQKMFPMNFKGDRSVNNVIAPAPAQTEFRKDLA